MNPRQNSSNNDSKNESISKKNGIVKNFTENVLPDLSNPQQLLLIDIFYRWIEEKDEPKPIIQVPKFTDLVNDMLNEKDL